jgi:uncharacterized protein YbjT (DUF2867 family)/ligand-binding SRPBCC domain-containing protein
MNTRVLIAGATGYIGGRLLRAFEESGHPVRCLARRPAMVTATSSSTEIVTGDCLDAESLDGALAGIAVAYYLVHSMAAGPQFAELDHQAALNFGRAAARAGAQRIVYLGGLGGDAATLSTHLKSRTETGEVLRQSGVPVVEFRASIVIGAGSLSFGMIEALVERLPAMICPRWVDTKTQPIAIDDVLAYLRAALDLPAGSAGIYEIGGPDVVSYGGMMRAYARLRGLRRLLIPVPILTPRLSGLWLGLVTPAHAKVGRSLVEGLRNATVVRSESATRVFAIQPMPTDAAFVKAIEEGTSARLQRDTRMVTTAVPAAQAFAPIRRIGGTTGWYYGTLLWKSRSWLDRRFGGAGMRAGRRHDDDCAAGDLIDGWHVDAFEPDRLLRLSAGLKLPGSGWLEWRVSPAGSGSTIRQTASFDPRGVMGRLYWYAVLPLHALIFGGMLRQIVRAAEAGEHPSRVSVFTYRSTLPIAADTVFEWHERPEALTDLAPRWLVTLERRTGDLRDGRVTLKVGIWPLRVTWEARHFGYVAGRQFCDEQTSGPFALWRHTHRTEAIDTSSTLYEDRVEYAVRGGRLANRIAAWLLRPLLAAAFAQRHRIVRAGVTQAR